MANVATLGIEIQTKSVDQASHDLNQLSAAAKNAQGAEAGLAAQSAKTNAVLGAQSGVVSRISPALNAASGMTQRFANDNKILAFQLNDVAVSLASGMNPMMVAVQQGSQISQLYGGNVAMAFRQTGIMAAGAARAIAGFALANPLALASVAALGLGLRSVVNDLNDAGYASIGYSDVAVAAFQVVGDGISSILLPAIQAISPATTSVLDATAGFFKDWGNSIIRLALGSFETIKAGVMALPAAFVAAGGAAANGFIAGIEYMVRGAMAGVNSLIAKLNGALPDGFKIDDIGKPMDFSIDRVNTDAALASIKQQYADLDATATKIMNTDYLGQFGDAIKAKAISNSLKEVENAAGGAGNALKKAATEAKDPWDKLRTVTPAVAEAMNALKQKATEIADATNAFGSELGGMFQGLITGTMTWEQAAVSALKSVLGYLNKLMTTSTGNGLFGGGFLGSLLGGLFSFDGGGFTGAGTRAGGIDGKGGFPAILHPNETVIDHTKGQRYAANSNSGPIQVQVHVLPSGEFDSRVAKTSRNVSVNVMKTGIGETTSKEYQRQPMAASQAVRRGMA